MAWMFINLKLSILILHIRPSTIFLNNSLHDNSHMIYVRWTFFCWQTCVVIYDALLYICNRCAEFWCMYWRVILMYNKVSTIVVVGKRQHVSVIISAWTYWFILFLNIWIQNISLFLNFQLKCVNIIYNIIVSPPKV